jgi:hypothetical protein
MLRLRRWVGDTRIEITLSILTPFLAYWPPENLGGSGVLATVTAGLYISWNGLRLTSAATRLQGIFFWKFLVYLIEAMVFLITGPQARTSIFGIRDYSIFGLAISATLVSALVIIARFARMYPATYVPRWLIPAVRRKDPHRPGSGQLRWPSPASETSSSTRRRASSFSWPLPSVFGALAISWDERTDLGLSHCPWLLEPEAWHPGRAWVDRDLRWYRQHHSLSAQRVGERGGWISDPDLAGRLLIKDVLFLVASFYR